MHEIGQAVRAAREKKGISQEKLAELADVSQTTIDKIERGETKRSRFLPKIASVLGLSLNSLDPEMVTYGGRSAAEREVLAYIDSNDAEMPVYSARDEGGGYIRIEEKLINRSPRPWQLKQFSQSYGIYFPSGHMFPEIGIEDTVYVNPSLPISINHTYVFFHINQRKKIVFVGRLVEIGDTEWVLCVWHPEMTTIRLSREEWVGYHRVVGRFSRF